MMKMLYLDHWNLDCRKLCSIYKKDPVSSTNKLQRYENRWKRKGIDQERLKRYINQQPRCRTYLDPDPNRQTVKIYTYLTFETTENLNNDWIFKNIKELLLIFLRYYNSMVATQVFTDEIIWCLDLLQYTIDDVFFWLEWADHIAPGKMEHKATSRTN